MLSILLDAKRWTVDSEPKAWARIGAAYRESKSQVHTEVMRETLDRMYAIYRSAQNAIAHNSALHVAATKDERRIKAVQKEKRRLMFELQASPMGQLTKNFTLLVCFLETQNDVLKFLKGAVLERGRAAEMALAPPTDSWIGERLAGDTDRCIVSLNEARRTEAPDPTLRAIQPLAAHLMRLHINRCRKHGILDLCARCGGAMYVYSARKRFCSNSSEGRECGHLAANQRAYQKKPRQSQARMSRTASARLAAKARWKK
jgi:hypothetical protein